MNPAGASDAIVQEITIRASAERIFEALTNPDERLKWWWRSEGKFQITHVESDLRVGGKWMMRGAGMGDKPLVIAGEYRQIERPRLLVFTWLPDWQEDAAETLVRWDLEEKDGVTTVRLTHSGFTSEASRATYRGWPQILGGLQGYVEQHTPKSFDISPIGYVRSTLKQRSDAPRQGWEGAPDARLEIHPDLVEGLDGIESGQDIWIFTWLHESQRSVLKTHPRDDVLNPMMGVFATRSPDRPNPIGLHRARVLSVDGDRWLQVQGLEAIDGTPIVDIKPVIERRGDF